MLFHRRAAMEQEEQMLIEFEDDYIVLNLPENIVPNTYEMYPIAYAHNSNQHHRLRTNHRSSISQALIRHRNLETQHSFQNLERFIIEGGPEYESKMCSICLGDLSIGIKAIRLPTPCSHVFHQDCIIQWLNKSNTCPLCRRPVC